MTGKNSYPGIDYFRIIAALLVVAIHLAPLANYNPTANLILTGIIARIAVPFFFMTSGFFLFSEHQTNAGKLKKFLQQTLHIYCIAILLYLPLNIYNHYFAMANLLPNIIQDLLFDGTLYHLWYFPASMIGAALAWILIQKYGFKMAISCTGLLYLLGLLGDSYFGIAQQIPLLHSFYHYLFELFDYTRNGIFFAPLFFVLGGIIATNKHQLSRSINLQGIAITLSLMIAEGLLLHSFNLQRHDSMYLLLVPVMFFLFSLLTTWQGPRITVLRNFSLIIYIIHPMVIVIVRLYVKLFPKQAFVVNNRLIYYLAVVCISALIAWGIVFLQKHFTPKPTFPPNTPPDRAWLEINLTNLQHNALVLQTAMPHNCQLMAVVKAEGYGHGAVITAAALNQIGVQSFAVATIEEGIALRKNGIQGEILIMGYTSPLRASELLQYDLIQTLIDYDYALNLNGQGYHLKTHLKIDTGMHRLGFDYRNLPHMITTMQTMSNLAICGIYTHLAVATSLQKDDIYFTQTQINNFHQVLAALTQNGINLPPTHLQSSYGLLNYPELICNYVRVGIALYGLLSSPNSVTKLQPNLQPVLSLKARVILIRNVAKNESIGYNREFITTKNSRIAILPIGYADGLPRTLSNKGAVLLHGKYAPIIGLICMDQLTVDITDIPQVQPGDIATIIGKDGAAEISAMTVADQANSITNELLSRMGRRLKVVSTN